MDVCAAAVFMVWLWACLWPTQPPVQWLQAAKVMSNFFLHANWEQQTKEGAVVDGTSCCVILEYLVKSIACIT